jgi:hypothetical protein
MHLIIKRPTDPLTKHQPKFWSASEQKYQTAFSVYEHDYSDLGLAHRECPSDGIVISELSRHYGSKQQYKTYQNRHSRSVNLVILGRRTEWVVYGSPFRSTVDIAAVTLTSTEWTVRTIAEQAAAGNIAINPVLKRRHNWGMADKSKYIESLMLGFPVSQIVIAAGSGRFDHTVVDGNQRLLAIIQFYGFGILGEVAREEELALVDLDYRSDLAGLTRTQILADPALSQAVADLNCQLLRVVRVTNWQDQSLLDNLSLRLND